MFKMKPKLIKYYSNRKKTVTLCIDRIMVNADIMMKIINLFEFKNAIIITDLEKDSILFDEFKKKNIKYTTSIPNDKNTYLEVVFMISDTDKDVLNFIVETNPEVIFIEKINDSISWNQYLYNAKTLQRRKNDIYDFHMEFVFKENEINITYNTELYTPTTINEKIKQIISEN